MALEYSDTVGRIHPKAKALGLSAPELVIFLDIDGVLNDHKFSKEAESCLIKPECVKRFNRIIEAADPDIVLSSAWRYMIHGGVITTRGFEYMLRTHGVSKKVRIVGYTVEDEVIPTRGAQITHWIKCNWTPDRYVVLDNDEYDIRAAGHSLIQTDGKVGLQDHDVELVKLLLERGNLTGEKSGCRKQRKD